MLPWSFPPVTSIVTLYDKSATAQRSALDIGLLDIRARLNVAGYLQALPPDFESRINTDLN
jgi:hypothetical protein